jgi:hypothetical protein
MSTQAKTTVFTEVCGEMNQPARIQLYVKVNTHTWKPLRMNTLPVAEIVREAIKLFELPEGIYSIHNANGEIFELKKTLLECGVEHRDTLFMVKDGDE